MVRFVSVYELIEHYIGIGTRRDVIDNIIEHIDRCVKNEHCKDVDDVLEVSDRVCEEFGTGGCTPAMLAASMITHGISETVFGARYLALIYNYAEYFEPATDIGNGFAIMLLMVTNEPRVKEMVDRLATEYRRFDTVSVVTANAIAAVHTSTSYNVPLSVTMFSAMFLLSTLYGNSIIDVLRKSGYINVKRMFRKRLSSDALYGG